MQIFKRMSFQIAYQILAHLLAHWEWSFHFDDALHPILLQTFPRSLFSLAHVKELIQKNRSWILKKTSKFQSWSSSRYSSKGSNVRKRERALSPSIPEILQSLRVQNSMVIGVRHYLHVLFSVLCSSPHMFSLCLETQATWLLTNKILLLSTFVFTLF